jgi:hypothetical protein
MIQHLKKKVFEIEIKANIKTAYFDKIVHGTTLEKKYLKLKLKQPE